MIPQDEIFKNNEELGTGKVLLSEPFMWDPNFKRSVVLLTEYATKGTLGYILNRPLDILLSNAIDGLNGFDTILYYGGPVEPDSLHFIHTLGTKIADTKEVSPGLFWGGNFEQLIGMISDGLIEKNSIRFFLGYSGWDSKQLEDELEQNSWFVTSASSKVLLAEDSENLWKSVLEEKGGKYKMISNFPEDPNLN